MCDGAGVGDTRAGAEGAGRGAGRAARPASFRNLVESAEKMPEADYGFQATKDTRTFAGFVGHTINSAFNSCSRAKGEPNPNKEDLEKVTVEGQARRSGQGRAGVLRCGATPRRPMRRSRR